MLRQQVWSSTHLYASSDRWTRVPAETLASISDILSISVSAVVAFGTELLFAMSFHNVNQNALVCLFCQILNISVDSFCGQGSKKAACDIHSVPRSGNG